MPMEQTLQVDLPNSETRKESRVRSLEREKVHAVIKPVSAEKSYDCVDYMMFDCIMANSL